MWPFKKNIMRGFGIEISSYAGYYNIRIWQGYNSFNPTIVASKYGLKSYTEAAEEADKLWNEIRAARIKLFGE